MSKYVIIKLNFLVMKMVKPTFLLCKDAPKFVNLNQIAVHNNTVYLAGVVGMSDSETIVPGGIEQQTRQVFQNIRKLLLHAGSDLDHIISLNIYLDDKVTEAEQQLFNQVYCSIFAVESQRPLRCCVQVRLQEGFMLEVVNVMAALK